MGRVESSSAALLARGPWAPEDVDVRWHQAAYEPSEELTAAADAQVAELSSRGSPAHDGMAARMRDHEARDGGLWMELQPARWALRLVEGEACDSLTALCVVRREDGWWLAGRRAAWLATWAERWALGAGGAVEVGESPVETLFRELEEEWQLRPVASAVEALVRLPNGVAMLVGQATVALRRPAGARRRARRVRLVAARSRGLAGRGRLARATDGDPPRLANLRGCPQSARST